MSCERLLLPFTHDQRWAKSLKSPPFSWAKSSNSSLGENTPSLGWRRNILLVKALHSPDSGRTVHHARALEAFCSRNGIRLSLLHDISGIPKTLSATRSPTTFTSPRITESYPSSPHVFNPDISLQRLGRIDTIPPLSLDGLQSGKTISSPPEVSHRPKQLAQY
ncbi:hypothetical protein like AT1G61850 [Hibiscus trionum]|uniref:Uncharacterized protein n=1 Tax=Hibiscus trionum TaxID=183268 RepID=A0A9W7J2D6_HIBTR|nr:hypothetical protein like AT1G61850 [Hibiscus trionum]